MQFCLRILSSGQQYALIVLLSGIITCHQLVAQEVMVSGEASVLENNTVKTRLQYEYEALMMARENALETVFGTSVMSEYTRSTVTEMHNRSVAFNSDKRNNFVSTFPNGIWVKDESHTCNEEKDLKGNYWLKCNITGYARKIESPKINFITYTLDGTDPNLNKSDSFTEGESGYLYFKCPDSGYIIVFYDDMEKVQRCIPYNSSNENYFQVTGNRDYIFFSKNKSDYISDKNQVDQIEFFTEMPIDYNLFYVLFSPVPFSGYFYNPPEKLEKGYTTFKSLDRESFHSWLQENRVRNSNLQVQIIGVTINKTP